MYGRISVLARGTAVKDTIIIYFNQLPTAVMKVSMFHVSIDIASVQSLNVIIM